MSTAEMHHSNKYQLVSGLEIHVQLNTHSKIFSSDSATFGAEANSHISAVSLALPGALPKINKEVIEKAIRIGLALNCSINQSNHFDRKNYFYADLPKGYQITQDTSPICINGFLNIELADGSNKKIRINRIHLEEDAGKSIHDQDENYSFVDLNRAGVPLIEIVTEPDLNEAEEAAAVFSEIRKLVRHLNVSDGNMEEGSLRCDANISIRPHGDKNFGTRCEVKNLNSIRNVRRAINFEFDRQAEVIEAGGKIIQSTLNFDAENGTTSPMRSKEEANDYRYFADPDLQPIKISDEWLKAIKSAMPKLPNEIAEELVSSYKLGKADAALFAENADLLAYFNGGVDSVNNIKIFINWLIGPVRARLADQKIDISDYVILPKTLAQVVNLVADGKLNQQLALQQLIPTLELQPDAKVLGLATDLNLLISNDADELESFVSEVLKKFPQQVEAYKKGKKGVLGLFVGEIMKMAKGKADAKKVNLIVLEKLK
ncbi:aspartyl-tRNA(Asn)/glutamyl-tRNA(Gln) amidotransferase subunit B [Pedobacter sp. UYP30]|uniref:Asp-tRNA(Asn)/Glu-tRNA(Gln) amidotransferase subunit GatB n=1 Tax=Pedobacter sp. UYP30 TaxID=1756400 RepID=UPI0033955919